MTKATVTLAAREKIADATYAFTLELAGMAFPFRPGQTVDVTFPDPPHQDDAGNRRTFSIACAPGRKRIVIATRVRGSAFKRSLVDAPFGTALDVDGPYGSFTLPRKPTEACLLAGGIGVTPFRSMVEDALERSVDDTLTLIHSSRAPAEAPFLLELLSWASRSPGQASGAPGPRFRYVPTMTRLEDAASSWSGERRRVGPELLSEVLPRERSRPLYYVAGPGGFVQGAVEALQALGVDEERIRQEEFPGY
jgi:ferredoxin-NADP reductase